MLIHIRPRLYCPTKYVTSIRLDIEPLGLNLTDRDIAARRPYPNKDYSVVCRREGNKAIDGILVEAHADINEFKLTVIWAIEALMLVAHEVNYKLLEHDFQAASDDIMLWYGRNEYARSVMQVDPFPKVHPNERQIYSSRLPEWAKNKGTMCLEPVMEIFTGSTKRDATEDTLDENGLIVLRRETFSMPTIEPERLSDPRLSKFRVDRRPTLKSAFRCG
jgi:hypothetical protein